MGWLRRAGRGTLADGAVVIWSVAEGARGRRWRWSVSDGEGLRHVGLIELDGAGRFARLELDAADALITLHPDVSATAAHGNVVHADGVEPLSLPWDRSVGIAIDGDPFGSALCPGVGDPLVVAASEVRRMATPPGLPIDARGVPVLAEAAEWALEE